MAVFSLICLAPKSAKKARRRLRKKTAAKHARPYFFLFFHGSPAGIGEARRERRGTTKKVIFSRMKTDRSSSTCGVLLSEAERGANNLFAGAGGLLSFGSTCVIFKLRGILMNHFVICVIDFIVKVLMVLAVGAGIIIALAAVKDGTPGMALVGLMPTGAVIAGCGFWCVLSGIYHNTRVQPRPALNRDVEPTFDD